VADHETDGDTPEDDATKATMKETRIQGSVIREDQRACRDDA
jgi:hypothetical protein